MLGSLATGHPAIPTGDFDFTPLLYAALALPIVRPRRRRDWLWVIPVAILGGGIVDSTSDAIGLSTATTASTLILLGLLVSWRRTWGSWRRHRVV